VHTASQAKETFEYTLLYYRLVQGTDSPLLYDLLVQAFVPCIQYVLYFSHEDRVVEFLNLLNDELNPICHLLILLGDLTFMGTCIVSILQYISNKIQRYTVYLYLEIALHVSGGSFTHH
jgi:hypothetical protein